MAYRGAEDHPLRETCGLWCDLIVKAKQVKERLYGGTAKECMSFFNGPHDFMYGVKNAKNAVGMYLDQNVRIKTTFKVTTNKVAEIVQRFGPSLYFNNPHRQVGPRLPAASPMLLQMFGDPMLIQMAAQQIGQREMVDMAVSELMSWVLNFTPDELDLQNHSRLALVEALVKGMGCCYTEVYQPSGSTSRLIGTFYDSSDRLIYDPDADTPGHCMFQVRECIHPVWEVEDEYGIPRGTIKGNFESAKMSGMIEDRAEFNRDRFEGKTNDLLVYYKIYSKMGIGGRLKGADEDMQEVLDSFGDNVFLVVAKNVPFPLNLPPQLLETTNPDDPAAMEQVFSALRWPIPYWADNEWPASEIGFHPVPGSPYPMSHLKPGLGELRFINWCLSFLADKVYVTSRDFIVVAEHVEKDLRTTIKEGDDLEVIQLKSSINKKISECIQWLQHPPMNKDILEIVQLTMQMFDKRVGLTDLLYGVSAAQFRSAAEADVKSKMTTIVIDDMRERTAQWQKRIARKEGLANRWLMGPTDMAPLFGEQLSMDPMQPMIGPLTSLWAQFCYSPPNYQDLDSIYRVVRELDYRIEADSLAKPNTDRDLQNMDQFLQSPFAMAIMGRYQGTGDPTQVNALMTAWCKPRQLDPRPFLFPAFAPMPMITPGQQQGRIGGPPGAAA